MIGAGLKGSVATLTYLMVVTYLTVATSHTVANYLTVATYYRHHTYILKKKNIQIAYLFSESQCCLQPEHLQTCSAWLRYVLAGSVFLYLDQVVPCQV